MTVKKKPTTDDAKDGAFLEVVDRTLGTKGFRLAMLALLLSMHPLGRQILGTVGFKFPDEQKITVAAEQASQSKTEIGMLVESVKELGRDVSAIKANNAILNAKVDRLDQAFTGFQVDFNRYKTAPIQPSVETK